MMIAPCILAALFLSACDDCQQARAAEEPSVGDSIPENWREALTERILREENRLEFNHRDFGPWETTHTEIGLPWRTLNPAVVAPKMGLPNSLKMVVTALSHLEPQRIIAKQAGLHKKGHEYRYVSYSRALEVCDAVLADENLAPHWRTLVGATKAKIISTMGDADTLKDRTRDDIKQLEKVAEEEGPEAIKRERDIQIARGVGA